MADCRSIQTLTDTQAFIGSLDNSIARIPSAWRNFFDSPGELIVTRAPGRLDLMGGIADYSGSLVLQWPIQSAVHVAIQPHKSKMLRIVSLPETHTRTPRTFEIDLDEFPCSGSSAD